MLALGMFLRCFSFRGYNPDLLPGLMLGHHFVPVIPDLGSYRCKNLRSPLTALIEQVQNYPPPKILISDTAKAIDFVL